MKALSIAATGMAAQQTRVDVISHNLANMSTTGYNARRAEFADLHYQMVTRPGEIQSLDGRVLPTGVQLGYGVRPAAVSIIQEQGSFLATNGELDLAIDGRGFFEVELPSGRSAYTRDGSLKRNADGQIVTSDGHVLIPDIQLPVEARRISINAAGQVYAYFADQVEADFLGQITLVDFVNPKGLEAAGDNLFLETDASGRPFVADPGNEGLGTVRQGYLEESSVDAVLEITELIKAQRGYELNSKVMTSADEMMSAMTRAI